MMKRPVLAEPEPELAVRLTGAGIREAGKAVFEKKVWHSSFLPSFKYPQCSHQHQSYPAKLPFFW